MSSPHESSHGNNTDNFTYGDYRSWPEGERWEIIGGKAYNMSAAPTLDHQALSSALQGQLYAFLKGKPCRPFAAPVDVFLPRQGQTREEADKVDTVVQPDIVVVCDQTKLDRRGIFGSPEVIMEILSPSTVLRDMNTKKDLYRQHGCREYWIWDQGLTWVCRYCMQEQGQWDEGRVWNNEQIAESLYLEGLSFDLKALNAELHSQL